eukprot:6218110-Prymnesium_polylepis.1
MSSDSLLCVSVLSDGDSSNRLRVSEVMGSSTSPMRLPSNMDAALARSSSEATAPPSYGAPCGSRIAGGLFRADTP